MRSMGYVCLQPMMGSDVDQGSTDSLDVQRGLRLRVERWCGINRLVQFERVVRL
jgi:hypothetical protein